MAKIHRITSNCIDHNLMTPINILKDAEEFFKDNSEYTSALVLGVKKDEESMTGIYWWRAKLTVDEIIALCSRIAYAHLDMEEPKE